MKKLKKLFRILNSIITIQTNNIIFVYRKNTRNIGDLSCCPKSYFEEFKNYPSIDILALKDIKLKNKIFIVGGGGLFQSFFYEKIKILEKLSKNNIVIYWGAGTDNTATEKLTDLSFLKNSKLVGLRDKNTKYDFVPCASCMSELFDKYSDTEILHDTVLYLHKDYSIPYITYAKDYPYITNKDNKSFEEIIKFLASTKIIITNSYHGAYWGCLLNKKVIVLPWIDKMGNKWLSNKFEQFPFPYIFCEDITQIKDCLNKKLNNSETLIYSREQNKLFLNKVLNILKTYNKG